MHPRIHTGWKKTIYLWRDLTSVVNDSAEFWQPLILKGRPNLPFYFSKTALT
jgi:hypothetical protein